MSAWARLVWSLSLDFNMDAPLLLSAVTLLSAMEMVYLARRVGWCRLALNIMPPAVTGPPEFERTFRAQQNCVEFYPPFLVALWSCGVFFNEPIAAVGGVVYMIARMHYFNGYAKAAHKRWPGFWTSVTVFCSLSVMGLLGIGRQIVLKYFYTYR